MGASRKVTTPYEEFVKTNLPQYVRAGQGAYNYKELAEMVGLKPTGNFRRRVNELANEGVLQKTPTFTPRGGIENRFHTPTDYATEIPF